VIQHRSHARCAGQGARARACAASAFVAQFLIQVYVVPLVETPKRRLERWEQDVLDLGELLSGRVRDAARQAESEQVRFSFSRKMLGNPDFDPETFFRDHAGRHGRRRMAG
jgi:hypothetical protein